MKKIVAFLLCAVMLFALAGCSSSQNAGNTDPASVDTPAPAGTTSAVEPETPVEISLLNSKPEITDALEAAAKDYKALTGVSITVYQTDAPGDWLTEAYAAGDPATLSLVDYGNVKDFSEYFLNLSGEDWTADGGSSLGASFNGNLYGFPFAVEARGVCYNKTAIEEVLGKAFDPDAYADRESFKGLLEELRAGGMENPIVLNAEDWSIGSHYLQTMYSLYDGTMAGGYELTSALQAGTTSIADVDAFNEAMDTLELFMEYNYNKQDPLAADYDMNACYCAEGTVAFWLNGTFAWPDFSEFADDSSEYGVMALPVSTNCAGYGRVSAASTKYIVVDNTYATKEQQAAALAFLNWLVYTAEGNNLLVNQCGIVPAFSNITLEMSNPFNVSLMKYVSEGHTICVFNDLPADHRSALGGDMQKYIAGEMSRKELAADLDAYWQSQN